MLFQFWALSKFWRKKNIGKKHFLFCYRITEIWTCIFLTAKCVFLGSWEQIRQLCFQNAKINWQTCLNKMFLCCFTLQIGLLINPYSIWYPANSHVSARYFKIIFIFSNMMWWNRNKNMRSDFSFLSARH